ncbi:hypothetical protein ACW9HJ_33620 [Nocardia gipuzkoensis]
MPLPNSRELLAAMDGHIPEQHPAAVILRAAFLLATIRDWVLPDQVATADEHEGSVVLNDIGIGDITTVVRAVLIDRIENAADRYDNRIGPAIDAIARALWEYRRADEVVRTYRNPFVPDPEAEAARMHAWRVLARRDLIEARAYYTRLRRPTTWIDGPPRHGRTQRVTPPGLHTCCRRRPVGGTPPTGMNHPYG